MTIKNVVREDIEMEESPAGALGATKQWGIPYQSTEVKSLSVSDSLWPRGLQPTRLLHPWDSPGKITGVGILQGIFPTQGLNPSLPQLQADILTSEPPGKPQSRVWSGSNQSTSLLPE